MYNIHLQFGHRRVQTTGPVLYGGLKSLAQIFSPLLARKLSCFA